MKLRIAVLPLVALFALFLSSSAPEGPSDFVGQWVGLADGQIPFTMDVTIVEEKLHAVINAREQGMVDMKSDFMEYGNEDEFRAGFETPDGTSLLLEGGLKEDGTISGKYTLGEQVGTYVATKKKEME